LAKVLENFLKNKKELSKTADPRMTTKWSPQYILAVIGCGWAY
jgi:hypothetical protein